MSPIRLPFAPLEQWFATKYPANDMQVAAVEQRNGAPSSVRMAEVFGFSDQVIRTWRSRGLTVWTADTAACRVGLHPSYLWPDWFDLPAFADRSAEYGSGACSTFSGYQRHLYVGEEPCPACKKANRARCAEYRRRKAVA